MPIDRLTRAKGALNAISSRTYRAVFDYMHSEYGVASTHGGTPEIMGELAAMALDDLRRVSKGRKHKVVEEETLP